jgi:HEPN domain-containing protein
MKNRTLAIDYVKRSMARCKALTVLFNEESYADVVRESQEVVELCLKAVLRWHGIEPARVHDVSEQIEELKKVRQVDQTAKLDLLITASRELRRDRELAFYGGEDFTPGEFYKKADGVRAIGLANESVRIAEEIISEKMTAPAR